MFYVESRSCMGGGFGFLDLAFGRFLVFVLVFFVRVLYLGRGGLEVSGGVGFCDFFFGSFMFLICCD